MSLFPWRLFTPGNFVARGTLSGGGEGSRRYVVNVIYGQVLRIKQGVMDLPQLFGSR